MENQEIQILINIILTLLVILFVLIFYLTVRRVIQNVIVQKRARFIQKYNDDIYSYLIKGEQLARNLVPDVRWKIEAMEHVFIHYLKTVESDELLKKVSSYAEKYFVKKYRKYITHRNWSKRMNTLYYIDTFQVESLYDEVDAMFQTKKKLTKDEYFQMYKILINLPNKHEKLWKNISEQGDLFSEFEYRKLLMNLKEEHLDDLFKKFAHLPYRFQLSLIDVIGIRNIDMFIPKLEQLLAVSDKEMRLRILKALSLFPHLAHPEKYFPFAQSEHWEERMFFAKLVIKMGEQKEIVHYLQQLIKDPSWWVRKQAAKSFAVLRDGYKMLESIVESNEDRFAVDMAKEMLRKTEVS